MDRNRLRAAGFAAVIHLSLLAACIRGLDQLMEMGIRTGEVHWPGQFYQDLH